MKRVLALLLALALPLSSPLRVHAQGGGFQPLGVSGEALLPLGASGVRIVTTGEELLVALEDEQDSVIQLAGDITVNNENNNYYVNQRATVDTGPYTITFTKFIYFVGYGIDFYGTGTVIQVDGSALNINQGSVTAEGAGAIALHMKNDAMFLFSEFLIHASGNGAVGVYNEGDFKTRDVNVRAYGNDSIGVRAGGRIQLEYSWIQAEGQAVVSDIGEITLSGCGVQPLPANAELTAMHGAYEPYEEDWITTVGNPLELHDTITLIIRYPLSGGAWILEAVYLPVVWDISKVDYNTPGKYPVTAEIIPPVATDYLTWDPVEMTVTVLYADQPNILSAKLTGTDLLMLQLVEEIVGANRIRVYCSDDGGESWRDLNALGMVEFEPNAVVKIQGLPDEVTYQFYIQAMGGPMSGTSNILEFYADPEERDDIGEREGDGGDGDDGDKPPPVTNPPPIEPPVEPPVQPPTDGGGKEAGDGNQGDGDDEGGGTSPTVTPPSNPQPENTGGEGGLRGRGASRSGVDLDTTAPTGAVQVVEEAPADPVEQGVYAVPHTPAGSPGLPAVATMLAGNQEEPAPDLARSQVFSPSELSMFASLYPDAITFLSGSLSVDLPTAALLDAVGDNALTLQLEQPREDSFTILLFSGDVPLADLGGEIFRVYLPLLEGDKEITGCLGEDGASAPVSLEAGKVVAALTRTGTYQLEVLEPVELSAEAGLPAIEAGAEGHLEPEDNRSPVLAVCLGGAALAAGAVVLLRGRRGPGA